MKIRQGFSLLEVSMVMIVMALIAGGILVGKNVVEASKVRAQVSQIEQFKTATTLFKESFGKLPGDIGPIRFNKYFPIAFPLDWIAYSHSGDENNLIVNIRDLIGLIPGPPSTFIHYELDSFFPHLSIAKMIDGTYTYVSYISNFGVFDTVIGTNFPIQKLSVVSGGILPFADADFKNYFHLCLQNTTNGLGEINIQPCMTSLQAYQLDLKIDDGQILSGSIQGTGSNVWPIVYGLGARGSCMDYSSIYDSGYNLANTGAICSVRIQMGVDSGYTH